MPTPWQAKGWILSPTPFQHDASTAANATGPPLGGYNHLSNWTSSPDSDSKANGCLVRGSDHLRSNIELQQQGRYIHMINSVPLQRDFRIGTVGEVGAGTQPTRHSAALR